MKLHALFSVAVCLTMQTSPVLFNTVACQGFSPATMARLQFVIDSFQNDPANMYVGGMAAAIHVDGLASWQGATGSASRNVDGQNNLLPGGTPFTTNTLSRMYSITKTFTAALTLELASEGVFSLEDPVIRFMPLHLVNPALNGAVTIRQLLAHESGYSSYSDEVMLQIAVAYQPTHPWTPFEALRFVHQINTPGAERKYSNTNYIVLGIIIETVTGKSLQVHFRERFFTPLALTSMYFDAREPQPTGTTLAAPHDNISAFNPIFQMTGQPVFPDAYTNISAFPFTAISTLEFASGAVISNISNLAQWGNLLFGGRATSGLTLSAILNSISPTPDDDGDFLGYGIFRTTKISTTDVFIGHDGNAPGYRSVMFYHPGKKMTIAILTNYRGAKLYDVAKALYASLPEFSCGSENEKNGKIIVCFNGQNVCAARNAAAVLLEKGAWLGGCATETHNGRLNLTTAGSNQLSTHSLSVFPNPASGQATISFKKATKAKVSIALYSMTGELLSVIYDGVTENNTIMQMNISTSHLPGGIYIIRCHSEGKQEQGKLVVIK